MDKVECMCMDFINAFQVIFVCWGPGGTQFWFRRECAAVLLEPQNPYPFLRVISAERGTHLGDFSLNIGAIFQIFMCSQGQHPKFWKNRPMFKDIFVQNGAHV